MYYKRPENLAITGVEGAVVSCCVRGGTWNVSESHDAVSVVLLYTTSRGSWNVMSTCLYCSRFQHRSIIPLTNVPMIWLLAVFSVVILWTHKMHLLFASTKNVIGNTMNVSHCWRRFRCLCIHLLTKWCTRRRWHAYTYIFSARTDVIVGSTNDLRSQSYLWSVIVRHWRTYSLCLTTLMPSQACS